MSNRHSFEGGARHLARLHGTEEDFSICPFFYKVGSCRHTDRCQRSHERPAFSCTVLVPHMWTNPAAEAETNPGYRRATAQQENAEFAEFFEDVFAELAKFGELEDMQVLENVSEHMKGHLFVKFYDEEDAKKCVEGMRGRFFAGRAISPEFSSVSDFKEARCRKFDSQTCDRGLKCNFSHIKLLPRHDEFLLNLLQKQPYAGERSNQLDRLHRRIPERKRRRSR